MVLPLPGTVHDTLPVSLCYYRISIYHIGMPNVTCRFTIPFGKGEWGEGTNLECYIIVLLAFIY